MTGHIENPPVISMLLPVTQESRQIAVLLTTRSMQRLAKGEVDTAWQDLLACRRLGLLIGQGACLVEALVGYNMIGMASTPSASLAHFGKLSVKQAARMRAELQSLELSEDLARKLDLCERFMYLDAVEYCARHGTMSLFKVIDLIVSSTSKTKPQNRPHKLPFNIDEYVDWNGRCALGTNDMIGWFLPCK